ncbi:MAG: PstS family phosphate ABC transporter substrate-binding protein [Candidatus Omnitrophica bacterium]|nr:PstS family phosphate ABC transporter substrate-binding protein [Candidatus Omnitrophota bacterium]
MKKSVLTIIFIHFWVCFILNPSAQAKEITIGGSTTVQPVLQEMAVYYENLYPDISITVKSTNSGCGIKAFLNRTIEIGMFSRAIRPEEFETAVMNKIYPSIHPIAMDGITIIVHNDNATESLTLAQIRNIFSGKISNWNSINNTDAPIEVVIRTPSSGTNAFFKKSILGDISYTQTAIEQYHHQDIVQHIQSHPHAIGYIGLGYISPAVKVLSIKGIYPTYQSISTGLYPLVRKLFLVTNGSPPLNSHINRLIHLLYTFEGQQIIEKNGFVPLTNY